MPKNYEKYYPKYDDYPIIGLFNIFDLAALTDATKTISFQDKELESCFCFVDIVGSTKIGASLKNFQLGQYIDRVLNPLGAIVKDFGGVINKTAGDSILFYFPNTSDSSNKDVFKKVLDCCMMMLDVRNTINTKLHEEKLPSVSYRISADYGKVKIGKEENNKTEEFFGSAVNLCAKINTYAGPNEMVIGGDLYQYVRSIPNYRLTETKGYPLLSNQIYPVYRVARKINSGNFLNHFKWFNTTQP